MRDGGVVSAVGLSQEGGELRQFAFTRFGIGCLWFGLLLSQRRQYRGHQRKAAASRPRRDGAQRLAQGLNTVAR
ncbi:hypothetical protein D3C78_1667710 [compost metagenome]